MSANLHGRSPSTGLTQWTLRDRAGDVCAAEPFPVFALKSLLYPVIPVVTLIVCLIVADEPLYGPYFLIGVLAFLGVADLLDVVPLKITPASIMALRSLIDIALRWGLLMLFLYLLLKLSHLGRYFDHEVVYVWAVVTPFTLWCGELIAQRLLERRATTARAARKAVIIGATPRGVELEEVLNRSPALSTEVLGYFEDRDEVREPFEHQDRVLGTLAEAADYVSGQAVDIV